MFGRPGNGKTSLPCEATEEPSSRIHFTAVRLQYVLTHMYYSAWSNGLGSKRNPYSVSP